MWEKEKAILRDYKQMHSFFKTYQLGALNGQVPRIGDPTVGTTPTVGAPRLGIHMERCAMTVGIPTDRAPLLGIHMERCAMTVGVRVTHMKGIRSLNIQS